MKKDIAILLTKSLFLVTLVLIGISMLACSAGEVVAWGGDGLVEVPSGASNVLAVACGDFYGSRNLLLLADGTVMGVSGLAPPSLSNVVAIAAANTHGLALRADGTVVAWGDNTSGETNVPPYLSNVVAIAAGGWVGGHSLALRADGTVVGWGDDSYGQTNVPGDLIDAVAIAAGSGQSLALRADGSVVVWGRSIWGGDISNLTPPPGLTNGVAIAAGVDHDLALTAEGSLFSWGVYGYGDQIDGGQPGALPTDLNGVVGIAAGGAHSLALRADGTVVAWGGNLHGETNVPAGLSNVVAIAAGYTFNLALIGSGPPVLHARAANPFWGTNGFSLSLPTRSGRVYRLEYKQSLADSTWTALPLAAGTGAELTLVDPAATGRQRFYRVRQW